MKVGFLGTGLMGLPMAQRLIETNVEGVRRILQVALDMGLAEDDYSSLYSAIDPEKPLTNKD